MKVAALDYTHRENGLAHDTLFVENVFELQLIERLELCLMQRACICPHLAEGNDLLCLAKRHSRQLTNSLDAFNLKGTAVP